jgi:hypothetical protein
MTGTEGRINDRFAHHWPTGTEGKGGNLMAKEERDDVNGKVDSHTSMGRTSRHRGL